MSAPPLTRRGEMPGTWCGSSIVVISLGDSGLQRWPINVSSKASSCITYSWFKAAPLGEVYMLILAEEIDTKVCLTIMPCCDGHPATS